MYSFWEISGWVIHGIIQTVLLWAPMVTPMSEPFSPPVWWYATNSWADWRDNLDHNRRPNSAFIDRWLHCAWWHMEKATKRLAQGVVDHAKAYLLSLIGYVKSGYRSLGHWVETVSNQVGHYLPSWASSVIGGLWILYWKLPSSIRGATDTWWGIWERIKREVRDWALNHYRNTVQWALDSIRWLQSLGYQVGQWYVAYSGWLRNLAHNTYGVVANALGSTWYGLVGFWQNPYGYILGWLGPNFQAMLTFARDCLWFWYNVWGAYGAILSAFLSNPGRFIGDRLERIIEERW